MPTTWSRTVLLLPATALLVGAAYLTASSASPAGVEDARAEVGLSADLEDALAAAEVAAGRDGVEIVVTSGRRSPQVQQELFDDAVQRHGSEQEARQWVLPPNESAHVRGEAVDVAASGANWLVLHGAQLGLCQRYANEWWHFELLTTPGGRCPDPEANASAG